MEFVWNNRHWNIIEKTHKEICDILRELKEYDEGSHVWGTTLLKDQLIILEKGNHIEKARQVLKHELMHAYIDTFFSYAVSYDEEALCNISANAHDLIHEVVTKYFESREEN